MAKREQKEHDRGARKKARRVDGAPHLKRETFYALENVRLASRPFKIVGFLLFVLIAANAVAVLATTSPNIYPYVADYVEGFYAFSTVCFFAEYLGRIWVADLAYEDRSPAKARARYVFSIWGLVDLLSFLPSMLSWFMPMTSALRDFVNVMRLVRLIKISRYMRGLRTIGRVLSKRRSEIVASFLVLALLVLIASTVMYEIEHPVQPDKFDTLLSGIYWAVTSVTATGYGDLAPVTPAGRALGSLIMFLSVALVAIPGGIFSAGFVAEFQNVNRPKIKREKDEDADPGEDGEPCEEAYAGTREGSRGETKADARGDGPSTPEKDS